jgi:hypothetical protein
MYICTVLVRAVATNPEHATFVNSIMRHVHHIASLQVVTTVTDIDLTQVIADQFATCLLFC